MGPRAPTIATVKLEKPELFPEKPACAGYGDVELRLILFRRACGEFA